MSTFGFCNLSIIPIRKSSSDKSEMVSQLLFGEYFEVLDEFKSWCYVKSGTDGYEGWIDDKQYLPVSKETWQRLKKHASAFSTDIIGIITEESENISFPIVIGSMLPFFKNQQCKIENKTFIFSGAVTHPINKISGTQLIGDAYIYLHAPYLWGGRSPLGIDCSGFTQMVYRINGLQLPRDSSQQALKGDALDFIEEAKAGDLAFFDDSRGNITHTGIILDNGKIIHASGNVHIDNLDHFGIFNSEKKIYTHKLRVIKKMFNFQPV